MASNLKTYFVATGWWMWLSTLALSGGFTATSLLWGLLGLAFTALGVAFISRVVANWRTQEVLKAERKATEALQTQLKLIRALEQVTEERNRLAENVRQRGWVIPRKDTVDYH